MVDEEHQARVAQFSSHWQALSRPKAIVVKGLFQIQLGTAPMKARKVHGCHGVHDSVSAPASLQMLRPDEDIVFIIGVLNSFRR